MIWIQAGLSVEQQTSPPLSSKTSHNKPDGHHTMTSFMFLICIPDSRIHDLINMALFAV